MAQRRELCLRHGKDRFGKPLKAHFKVPSYVTFYKFLKKLDLVDFGEKLSAWLQSQEGTLPRRLALHGQQETARAILDANGAGRFCNRPRTCHLEEIDVPFGGKGRTI